MISMLPSRSFSFPSSLLLLSLGLAEGLTAQPDPTSEVAGCEIPRTSAEAERIPQMAIDSLVLLATIAESDGLVLLSNGRLLGEWYFGRDPGPIQTMSATKSVVSMSMGRLLDTGAIASLDQPVSDFYPEWRQGRKRDVTLRMLLDHTSGIQNVPNAGAEIYPAPDVIQLALAAELSHEPGSTFSYNNKAVNLLGGIVEKAAGLALDDYVHREILAPLCTPRRAWFRDEAGNPHAMAGLELTPVDLARIGQLMLAGGVWNGERILSESWVNQMVSVSQPFTPRAGLLWWLLPDRVHYFIDASLVDSWRESGVDAAFVAAIEPMVDRRFDGAADFSAALDVIFGDGEGRGRWERATVERGILGRRFEAGRVRAFSAEGFLGQHLVVLPERNLVAVRMKRRSDHHRPEHNFPGFAQTVLDLFGPADPQPSTWVPK
jgi:CubicO group peptidase (beta-lactamase class C family)